LSGQKKNKKRKIFDDEKKGVHDFGLKKEGKGGDFGKEKKREGERGGKKLHRTAPVRFQKERPPEQREGKGKGFSRGKKTHADEGSKEKESGGRPPPDKKGEKKGGKRPEEKKTKPEIFFLGIGGSNWMGREKFNPKGKEGRGGRPTQKRGTQLFLKGTPLSQGAGGGGKKLSHQNNKGRAGFRGTPEKEKRNNEMAGRGKKLGTVHRRGKETLE